MARSRTPSVNAIQASGPRMMTTRQQKQRRDHPHKFACSPPWWCASTTGAHRMKRSCCGPLCEGDVEAEFAELSGQASGETRSLGALEVIGSKIVVLRPAL